MSSPAKILYFTGTRADFGLMQSVLQTLDQAPDFEVELLATGMHLMPEFGETIQQVKQSGYPLHLVNAVFDQDSKASMATFLGQVIQEGSRLVNQLQPDLILLLGDRAEMLAGASIGAYCYIPTIHIGGGDHTSTIDNAVRHAITRLSHLHFPATAASRQRLIDSGEAPWRCFNAGAPALDTILHREFDSREVALARLNLDPQRPVQLLILHPESLYESQAAEQMELLLSASLHPDYQTVIIYPNADAGGRQMIQVIERYRNQAGVHIHPSLAYEDYLHVMKHADLMIGNSSSGILEAPSFGLPVLNVGDRQQGREKAANIVDVPFEQQALNQALQRLRKDEAFRTQAAQAKNPYYNGGCGRTILETLREVHWGDAWLQK